MIVKKFIDNTKYYFSKIIENSNKIKNSKSQLDSLLDDLELGFKRFLPPKNPNLREESRNLWKLYLEEKNPDIFSEDHITTLTFEFSVMNNKEYWELLKNEKFINDNIIFALVRNFHYYWTDLEDFDYISEQIKIYLKKIKTDKKIIKKWQNSPEIILGTKNLPLEKKLLTLINHNIARISELYKSKEHDVLPTDLLANLIQFENIMHLCSKTDLDKNLDIILKLFKEFFNYSIKPKLRKDSARLTSKSLINKRNLALATITLSIDRNFRQKKSYKQDFIQFVLDFYGDPRRKKWVDFYYTDAELIFKKWLNEQDIEFFFDILIDEDPHDRKNFWKSMAGWVEESYFIIGSNVESNRSKQRDIERLSSSLKNVFKIKEDINPRITSNIFIMIIGNIAFIEFSESGNACFAYEKDFYMKEINPLFRTISEQRKLKLDNFKIKKSCIGHFIHSDGETWKNNIEHLIRRNAQI